MMIRLLASILLLAAWPANAEPPLTSGELNCDSVTGSDGCRLAWNMTATPRAYYQLQSYSVRQRGWKNLGGPDGEAYATRTGKARGGSLYRVLACDDQHARRNCVSSTVHWVLAMPSAADIPESVRHHQIGNSEKYSANDRVNLAKYTTINIQLGHII